MNSRPLPAAAIAAFHQRVAARRAAEESNPRPRIIWRGEYDELYWRSLALLDADDIAAAPATEAARRG